MLPIKEALNLLPPAGVHPVFKKRTFNGNAWEHLYRDLIEKRLFAPRVNLDTSRRFIWQHTFNILSEDQITLDCETPMSPCLSNNFTRVLILPVRPLNGRHVCPDYPCEIYYGVSLANG